MHTRPCVALEDIEAVGDRIATTAAHIDAATHRLLADIRSFDEAAGWHQQGLLSMAHWLHWRCGVSLGAAREKVRVATALGKLALLDEGLRRGELSFSKVRAVTRVATPENEATLLEFARASTASQLEKICRLYRGVQAGAEASCPAVHGWLRVRGTDDGRVRIEVELSADEAARVLAACDAAADRPADRLGGLMAMAESRLRGDAPARPPVEVTFHVDSETLEGSTSDGRGVSAETCRRLLCDAGVVPVLEDGQGKTLDVGRKTRTIPAAIRRALELREPTCSFPGCTHRITDAHHIVHWADGGDTALANLTRACRLHHTRLHEGRFSVVRLAGGDLEFRTAGGKLVPAVVPRRALPLDALAQLAGEALADGVAIGPATGAGAWDGTVPDYPLAVEALLDVDRGGTRRSSRAARGSIAPAAVGPPRAAEVIPCQP